MSYQREPSNMQMMGPKSYKERLKRESEKQLSSGDLKYSFGKPKKDKPLNTPVECPECGYMYLVSDITIGTICSKCGVYFPIKKKV